MVEVRRMGGAGCEVREEARTQRVSRVQALHGAQEAGNLGHTLPEPQRQEVQGQSVGVPETCRQGDRTTRSPQSLRQTQNQNHDPSA